MSKDNLINEPESSKFKDELNKFLKQLEQEALVNIIKLKNNKYVFYLIVIPLKWKML